MDIKKTARWAASKAFLTHQQLGANRKLWKSLPALAFELLVSV
jgi:hypothetical protein